MPAKAKTREPGTSNRLAEIDWTPIGWQRVGLVVPHNWSLTAVSGNDTAGSMRIERTGEADAPFAPFGVDIRWTSKIKKTQTAEMLDKRIQPLIDGAKQAAKKAHEECNADIIGVEDIDHLERGIVREYSWKGQQVGVGRIWRCGECGRLLIAQVQGTSGARFVSDARALLSGIVCHNQTDGWSRWCLYGIDAQVPDGFGLAKHQLMTTYLELRFGKMVRGEPQTVGESLTIEQWSVASVQLKGMYLDEWIESKSKPLLANTKIEKTEVKLSRHDSLEMIGKRGGLGYWMEDGTKALKSLTKPATNYAAYGWECVESNKVYLVQHMSAKPDTGVAKQVAERVVCHSDDEILD